MAAVLQVPAAPLGSFTATRIDAFTPVAASDSLYPQLQGDPADLSMGDFVARAVWDDGTTLADRRVRPLGAPGFPPDTWVQVTGTWAPGGGTQEPGAIPQIQVDTAVPTTTPANTYDN